MQVHQALVVGATSEIGAAVATELSARTDRITLWGRDAERLRAAAAGCRSAHVRTREVDVSDDAAMATGLAALREDGPLGVAVWTPGLFDWADGQDSDPARWRALAEVNLTAPAVFTSLVLPDLVAAAPSALVYLGSGAGHVAYPHNAAYVATKHGLTGLARATYLDVRAHGVKVSLVSPGMVAAGGSLLAPMTDEQRAALLRPEDVAAAVAFVVDFPDRGCPTEIHLQPHRLP
ncbi:SDR family NAD(P)-dependent oxidoreductase [Microlunatus flavus]|uniref:NADP-dependent 3-hydroxy acid dehydrogenase YdfG n=1 Tax=Microlunatus flavus TaxID=1036181 RepID=A0A1H9FXV4_9ACTN|nr:SDR family NAD(P)-dependent oxidoreductase [Microlunatus flavus]SEQ42716.1 NADP-dependent 3-hydroxy acid dehydrogenase YdfG [Microlunatus flavus]